MRPAAIVRAVLVCGLVLPLFAAGGDLQYSIPPGWIDLVQQEDSRVSPQVTAVARSGQFKIYAIDPESIRSDGTVNASFNVVEQPGKGKVTDQFLRTVARTSAAEAQARGFEMSVAGTEVVKLGGVAIGKTRSMMSAGGASVQLLQYLVPGKSTVSTLTYTAAPELFDHYKPIFEASAMATTGAYSHSLLRGIDFSRVAMMGAVGGVAGLLVALFGAARKKQPASPVQPTISSSLWECSTCKRKVPVRIEQCRCGTARTAT